MSILDELKKWTHPYEDEDEEFDDEDRGSLPKGEPL
jgi:cell division inhibitor SepF